MQIKTLWFNEVHYNIDNIFHPTLVYIIYVFNLYGILTAETNMKEEHHKEIHNVRN